MHYRPIPGVERWIEQIKNAAILTRRADIPVRRSFQAGWKTRPPISRSYTPSSSFSPFFQFMSAEVMPSGWMPQPEARWQERIGQAMP